MLLAIYGNVIILSSRASKGQRVDQGSGMGADRSVLLQGTLELLVLRVLALEPMHGWGIAQRLEQMSEDVFSVNQGSLYPALQRMKRKGWVGRSGSARPPR